MNTHPRLYLPDASKLSLDDAVATVEEYIRKSPAVLDLYDRTNPGPHDDVTACDVLAVNALNGYMQRMGPMTPMTELWMRRHWISEAAKRITMVDHELLGDTEFSRQIPLIDLALSEIEKSKWVGYTGSAKLLHRLRPNIVPIFDQTIRRYWYRSLPDCSWSEYLKFIFGFIRDSETRTCLSAMQVQLTSQIGIRLPTLRIWDIVLWQRTPAGVEQ